MEKINVDEAFGVYIGEQFADEVSLGWGADFPVLLAKNEPTIYAEQKEKFIQKQIAALIWEKDADGDVIPAQLDFSWLNRMPETNWDIWNSHRSYNFRRDPQWHVHPDRPAQFDTGKSYRRICKREATDYERYLETKRLLLNRCYPWNETHKGVDVFKSEMYAIEYRIPVDWAKVTLNELRGFEFRYGITLKNVRKYLRV